jgi:hypothetical protein
MSEPNEGTPAPSAQPPAVAPTPAVDENPAWLNGRLQQARKSAVTDFLGELGFKDPKEAKAALDKLQSLETASLSEKERVEKQIQELTPKAAKAERLEGLFKSLVDSKFGTLTEKQQQAIDAKANGDPERRWEIMDVMEAAGALTPAAASPALPAAKQPASTSPGAPPPPPPAPAQTPRSKWEAMKKTDPMQASLFYQLNRAAIEQSPSS